eukprot:TRINITY_DN9179_c0_g1_i1.p1 TRINITY_DN9179_c0_g1~~TRINITY_DN9179_c0_g1_i1.p1  ORF type:complete len:386 (-),score=44.00 TRINITY_DN9179_c0_g1_i1:187-1344(-)
MSSVRRGSKDLSKAEYPSEASQIMTVLRKLCLLGASAAAIVAILLTAAVMFIMLLPVELPLHNFDPNEDYSALDKSLLPLLTEDIVETAPGVRLHVWRGGPDQGPLAIFLHGFPEFAYFTWRHQLLHFIKKGYRVAAPDLRGYNTSSAPSAIQDYAIDSALTVDVERLVQHYAKAGEKPYLISHDWGSVIAWAAASKYPEMFEKVVIINVPHSAAFLKAPIAQVRRSWYILFFQLPHWLIAERFERNGYAFLLRWMGMLEPTAPRLSLRDVKDSQKALSQPGSIQGMTNYYMALVWHRNSADYVKRPISTPILVLWGLRDSALMPELAEMSMEYCLNGKLETIDTTHWVTYEKPDWVNERIDAFLTTTINAQKLANNDKATSEEI